MALVAVVAAMTCPAPQPQATVDDFKVQAIEAYRPWYQPVTRRPAMRRLKTCARNLRTRNLMERVQSRMAKARRGAISYYHQLTPYVTGEPGFARSAIEPYIVDCETQGYYGASRWDASNPYGAVGPYQLLGHGAPFPVHGIKDKMEHHLIAHLLWGGPGDSDWEQCL